MSKTIAQSEQLGRVSLEADYLFGRCIPHLDREGRMTGNPELVRAQACPLRPELTTEKVATLIAELAAVQLVIWYEVGARQCLTFPGFDRHQKGLRKDREAPSRIPPSDSANARPIAYSGPTPEDSGRTPAQCNAREVKGSSSLSSDASHPATPPESDRPRQNGSPGNPMAVLGPLIREHLYIHDAQPPAGYDPRRCADICTKLVKSGRYTVDDLREAILVIPRLRAGKVPADDNLRRWFAKQGKLTMRALTDRWGSGSVLEQLLHVVRKAEARQPTAIQRLLPGAA